MRLLLIASALLVAPLATALTMLPTRTFAASSPPAYARCAACHLSTGAGVPGAYPSLRVDARALAMKPEGRRYLALAVVKGLAGPITVEGKAYRGTMPMQAGMDDAAVAGVLTYVIGTLSTGGGVKPKPFTAPEIKSARAAGASMNAAAVAKSRPAPR
ncbi:c-type cytochrome [Sphingopyxis sp.]|uniref:c-type cytochrome n=1 Tax=Sphingopyxis sp. TaxID=1908224 RepID=UPI003D6D6194